MAAAEPGTVKCRQHQAVPSASPVLLPRFSLRGSHPPPAHRPAAGYPARPCPRIPRASPAHPSPPRPATARPEWHPLGCGQAVSKSCPDSQGPPPRYLPHSCGRSGISYCSPRLWGSSCRCLAGLPGQELAEPWAAGPTTRRGLWKNRVSLLILLRHVGTWGSSGGGR